MTSLRMRVVEAGAAKLRGRDELRDAGRLPRSERETVLAVRAILDAMLDCLTENADEWEQSAAHALAEPVQESAFVAELIDQLREDR